jgi:predicted enzyme related to lactoylglutathione lyase
MHPPSLNPVIHLELQTGNLARASDFYTWLFGWHAETVEVGPCSYLSLKLGEAIVNGSSPSEASSKSRVHRGCSSCATR